MTTSLMQYKISWEELHQHCQARFDHHTTRAEYHAGEAEKADNALAQELEKAGTVTDRMQIKSSTAYNNMTSARQDARARMQFHLKRAAMFKWKGGHLPEIDDFVLSEADLSDLEIIPD